MKATRIDINWHPGLSIFASESFLKVAGDEYGWLGGIDAAENIRCILPYTVVRKGFVRMIRFRVETILMNGEITIDEEKSFLNSAIDYFRSIRADIIIPATTNAIFRTYPDKAVAAPYGTYIIDLSQQEEALWNGLNSSHRRKVRLAAKQGVQVHQGLEYIETAYALVRDTFKRSKMGFMSYSAFNDYVRSFGENVKIMISEHDGKVQGSIIVPFSNHSAYYVYGGSIPDPVVGAMNLLHWEAIRKFRESGVKQYDFVGVRINPDKGSKQEGLMMFKERFGGKLVQGYFWKCALRPMKAFVYSVAVRIIKSGDIVDKERHKLKSI